MGLHPVLVYIDHGLRSESVEECALVAQFARERDLDFRTEKLDPMLIKNSSLGVQASARAYRYEALHRLAGSIPQAVLCTAHQADDRLEGFFISLIRSERWDRLSGMLPWNGKVLRPMWGVERAEIEEYARVFKVQWIEDQSNGTDQYLRNRVRKQLAPFVKIENPSWLKALDRVQSDLKMASGLLRERGLEWSSNWLGREEVLGWGTVYRIPNEAFADAEGRYHLLNWLDSVGMKKAFEPEQLLRSVKGSEFQTRDQILYRTSEGFELSPAAVQRAEILIPEWMDSIRWPVALDQKEVGELQKTADCAVLDKKKLRFPLTLRSPRIGDRLEPLGMKGSKLLSDLMSEEKLKPSEKHSSWLLCSEGQIVWWVGRRVDRRFAASASDSVLWKVQLVKSVVNPRF